MQAKIVKQYPLGSPADVWALVIHAPKLAAQARPGQFVMLKEPNSPHILARPFSIAAAFDENIVIIYQQVGKVTNHLPLLKENHELLMWGPLGRGFNLNSRTPLLLGGGVGLAPVLFAWLKHAKATLMLGFDNWQRFSLLSAVLAELKRGVAINQTGPNSKIVAGGVYVTSQRPGPGWQEECALVLDPLTPENLKPFDAIMACGPWPMLKKAASMATVSELPCQVAAEALMACGVGACQGCATPKAEGGYLNLCQAGPVLSSLQLDWERI